MKSRKEIQEIINAINLLKNTISDEQATQVSVLYPEWNENKEYEEGARVRKDGKLYKAQKKHRASREDFDNNMRRIGEDGE